MEDNPFEPVNRPVFGKRNFFQKCKDVLKQPWFIALASFFVAVLVTLFSINSIMQLLLHSRQEVTVPNLESMGIMDALQLVTDQGLALGQEGTEFNESLPAGTILRQHPPVGMRVREGRAVRVVISKGGQVVFVPNVENKQLAEAQSMLSMERLQVGTVQSIYSLDIKEGNVISQTPSSGTVVTRGALIDIEVSKGLPPVGASLMPDFVGQHVSKVREWAEGVAANVNVEEDVSEFGTPGMVAHQRPLPGQPLLDDKIISVVIVPMKELTGSRFRYEVSPSEGWVEVRIVARDQEGEKEIYKSRHEGGDYIDIPLSVKKATRVRVYVDGRLNAEQVVEPQ